MTSSREKFYYTRTLCCLLKSLEGVETEIELRNDSSVKGTIETVSSTMSVTMLNCVLTVGESKKFLQTLFIQGRKIRMVLVPDDINILKAMQSTIDKFNKQFHGRKEFLKPRGRSRTRGPSRGRGVLRGGTIRSDPGTFGVKDTTSAVKEITSDVKAAINNSAYRDPAKVPASVSVQTVGKGGDVFCSVDHQQDKHFKAQPSTQSESFSSNVQEVLKKMAYGKTYSQLEVNTGSSTTGAYPRKLGPEGHKPSAAEGGFLLPNLPYARDKCDRPSSSSVQSGDGFLNRVYQHERDSRHRPSTSSSSHSAERHKHSSRHTHSSDLSLPESRTGKGSSDEDQWTRRPDKGSVAREHSSAVKSGSWHGLESHSRADQERHSFRHHHSKRSESRGQIDHSGKRHLSDDKHKERHRKKHSKDSGTHAGCRPSSREQTSTGHDHNYRSHRKVDRT